MQDSSTAFQGIRPPSGTPQFPAPPDQQQHLKCPRCDSTNTKFCYYNNYNLSQPRHFCKSCRRYWTKGGALRNIPVGGGTRKNSKRASTTNAARGGTNNNATSSSSIASGSSTKRLNTAALSQIPAANPAVPTLSHLPFPQPPHTLPVIYPSAADHDRQLLDMGGSFSSLLTSAAHFGGLIDTAFHSVPCPGAVTLPITADLAGPMPGSGLDLLRPRNGEDDDNPPPPQNPADAPTAAADTFLGLHGVSGCWNDDGGPDGGVGGDATGAGGGWPGLSIYTPGSTFQ